MKNRFHCPEVSRSTPTSWVGLLGWIVSRAPKVPTVKHCSSASTPNWVSPNPKTGSCSTAGTPKRGLAQPLVSQSGVLPNRWYSKTCSRPIAGTTKQVLTSRWYPKMDTAQLASTLKCAPPNRKYSKLGPAQPQNWPSPTQLGVLLKRQLPSVPRSQSLQTPPTETVVTWGGGDYSIGPLVQPTESHVFIICGVFRL